MTMCDILDCCQAKRSLLGEDWWEKNPEKRLGSGEADAEEIKQQRFFRHINGQWEDLLKKRIRPKFVPTIRHPEDVSNFDEEFTKEAVLLSPAKDKRPIQDGDQTQFKDFYYYADWVWKRYSRCGFMVQKSRMRNFLVSYNQCSAIICMIAASFSACT